MRDEQAKAFARDYQKLLELGDGGKVLAVNAMLDYEDGTAYTERDYLRDISILETLKATEGDSKDGMIDRAIQWCKTRSMPAESA